MPRQIAKKHGCLNDDSIRFNCYYFQKNQVITDDTGFSFPLDTYVYGEQVDMYSIDRFNMTYTETVDYDVKGRLFAKEFMRLKKCLADSGQTKRKIKRLL